MTKDESMNLLVDRLDGKYNPSSGELGISIGPDFYHKLLSACGSLESTIEFEETHSTWHRIYDLAGRLGPLPQVQVMKAMLEAMNLVQVEQKRWIHKGLPLFLVWHVCRNNGWDWQHRRFAVLTFIEDILRDFKGGAYPEPYSGAYTLMTMDFALTSEQLNQFGTEVHIVAADYEQYDWWTDLIFTELWNRGGLATIVGKTPSARSHFEPITIAKQPLLNLHQDSSTKIFADGKAYERLVAILFGSIPGARVQEDVKGLFQVDVAVDLSANIPLALQIGPRIIVECKYHAEPASINVAAKILATCQTAKCNIGVIVSEQGITGEAHLTAATKVALQSYLQFGIAIVVLTKSDIKAVIESGNLEGLLGQKVANARLGIF